MNASEEKNLPSPVDARMVPENTTGREPDFFWDDGQPRYKCRIGCGYDTYDVNQITKHEAMHAQMGQTEVRGAPGAATLFDHLSRPIKFEE